MYIKLLLIISLLTIYSCKIPLLGNSKTGNISFIGNYNNEPYIVSLPLMYALNEYDVHINNMTNIDFLTNVGIIQSCDISPSLPNGLILDNNCSITGTPVELSPINTYIIHLKNTNNQTYVGSVKIGVYTLSCDAVSDSSFQLIGNGTVNNPYIICNSTQFQSFIMSNNTGFVELQADVSLTSSSQIGSMNNLVLNGHGHYIHISINNGNLSNVDNYNDLSMFDTITNSTFENIQFSGVINGGNHTSFFARTINHSSFINVHFTNDLYIRGSDASVLAPNMNSNIFQKVIIASSFLGTNHYILGRDLTASDYASLTLDLLAFTSTLSTGTYASTSPYFSLDSESNYLSSSNPHYSLYDTSIWIFSSGTKPDMYRSFVHVYE